MGTSDRDRSGRAFTAALCLTVTTAGLTSCGLVGGDGRSEKAFCSQLQSGNDKMRANYEASDPDDALSSFGAVFANMGQYTTMLHKLDDVAPDEIKSEMHDSREAWDKAADNAPDGIGLDSIAGSWMQTFMLAMMSNASMSAVDNYAQQHCGLKVFSL